MTIEAEPVSRAPWRGLAARWPEAAIVTASLVAYCWSIGRNGWGNPYYAAAVRSMTRSWHTFFYASLDPGGWVTVDKPPLAFWVQALAVRVLGFHQWVLLVPAAACGAATVALTMAAVRRVADRSAALVTGVTLGMTPAVVAMSRSNMPDIYVTFFAAIAAWAAVRSFESDALRWPVLVGVALGLGFVAKSTAIALVVPALAVGFAAAAPITRRRLIGLAAAVGTLAAVAGGWLLAVDLRGLDHRPWVGGSDDGSAHGLVFGYNVGVFGSNGGPGGGPPGGPGGGPAGLPGGGGFNVAFGGARGVGRMFNLAVGDQVMWWSPIALLGAVAALADRARPWRSPNRAAAAMWSVWALTCAVVFSWTEGVFHPYYVVEMAPALAALVGLAAGRVLRRDRSACAVGAVAALATVAVQVMFVHRGGAYRWLLVAVPLIVAAGLVAVGVASVLPSRARFARVAGAGGVVVAAGLLLAPAIWAWNGIRTDISGLFPAARPPGVADEGPFGAAGGGVPAGFESVLSDEALQWLDDRRTTETWIVGVSNAGAAEAAIIAGYDVVALGGFSGSDGAADVARVAAAVDAGRLRFLLTSGAGRIGGFGGRSGVFAAAADVCTPVDASNWGGSGDGVVDCRGKGAAVRAARTDPGGGAGPPPGDGGGGNGGGGGGPGPGGAPPPGIAECLAGLGVEIPPGAPPGAVDPAVAAALQECLGGGVPPIG